MAEELELTAAVSAAMRECVAGQKIVVFCSEQVDVPEWQQLLRSAGADDALVLPFDGAPLVDLLSLAENRSAAQLLAERHALLATLAEASPLSRYVGTFDPIERAVVIATDPLDPPVLGKRPRLGAKHPSWAFFEHKSVVDTLWDAMGVERHESVVFDQPGVLLDPTSIAAATVTSWQPRGAAPLAGGEGVSTSAVRNHEGQFRVRLMPRLAGTPCRLHGLVGTDSTAVFPPLELLVAHQVLSDTYLPVGTCPLAGPERTSLIAMTRHVGSGLRRYLAYRGGFSVDGILTSDGFRPTDFNGRVTSALEHVPPPERVAVHACALLARAGWTGLPTAALEEQVHRAFNGMDELLLRAPASAEVGRVMVQWSGTTLVVASGGHTHGAFHVGAGARGLMLTMKLRRAALPTALTYQSVAIAALEAAERLFGASFGRLEPPERVAITSEAVRQRSESGSSSARGPASQATRTAAGRQFGR